MVKMRNTVAMLIVGLIFVSVFTVFLPVEICTASGSTIYVDDDNTEGPWNGTLAYPYQHIQDAINIANESDTIYVHGGTYNENIIINKTITLIGEANTSTILKSDSGSKRTIEVTANNISISKFTIQNIDGSDNKHCVFLDHVIHCSITKNIIKDGENGIYIVGSSGNTIERNTIENNDARGISLSQSVSNTIRYNTIQNNVNSGMYFSLSSNSNTIYQNVIKVNHRYGISFSGSSNNVIHHNDFVDNYDNNANDPSTNTWDDGTEGNYWDDYTGVDENPEDDIGDTPYDIPGGGGNQDLYPLCPCASGNQKPSAYIDLISPNPATQGQTVNFNGHGMDDDTIIEWEWSSSKDGVLSSSEDFSSSSLSVGTHTIKFRVKDDDDQWSDYAQETLIINPQDSQNKKPVAEIVTINPNNADYEESVYFHGLGTDSDGIVVEYKWRSSKDGILSSESTFTKSDLSVGTHTIYFKVKDNQGEWSSEDSSSLVINPSPTSENEPPTADADGPYVAHAHTSISFDASKSLDPDGDNIVSYAWDFGDGTNGNGVTVNHSYNLSGNYTVELTISDDQGKTSTISTYANIATQSMNQNDKDNNDEENDSIPGFEITLIIIAIGTILSKKKHQ